MRYLILSDTHGRINYAIDAISTLKCDYCIHLGDMAQDCEDLQNIFPRQKFIFVKGNNDFWLKHNDFPSQRVFELEGKRFFVCHGHKYHVKQGLYELLRIAGTENADIVLFGHTHVQYCATHGKMTVVNPGSHNKYALIEIKDGKVECEVFSDD